MALANQGRADGAEPRAGGPARHGRHAGRLGRGGRALLADMGGRVPRGPRPRAADGTPVARAGQRAAAGISPALLVTIDDVRAGKPDPEGYLLAARKLGADPRRCLVVEDAAAGVAAGRAAGAVVAGLRGVDADIQIADLHQLTELLDQAENPRT